MVQVAKLSADLTANTAQFETGLERANRHLKKFSTNAADAGRAAATAFAVVGTALAALTVRQSRIIDDSSKMARSLGVGLSEFQALALVADEAGVAQDQLAVAFTKTQKGIAEAARGSKTYVEAFSRIGLQAKDLIDLKPDQQFTKIAEALAAIENPTERTALALEIFGKSGRGVINILENFAERSAEARAFNDKFNISLNEIDGAKVEEANDTFGRLGRALGGLGNTIAVAVAPVITGLSNDLLNAGVDGEDFGIAVEKGMQVAAGAIDVVRHAVLGLRLFFNAAATGIVDFAAKAVRTFFEAEKAIMDSVNSVTGSDFKPSDEIVLAIYELERSSKRGKDAVAGIVDEMKNFESTSKKFTRYQAEASERAAKAVTRNSKTAAAARIMDEQDVAEAVGKTASASEKASKDAAESIKGVGKSMDQASEFARDFGSVISNSFEDALLDGKKLSDVLTSLGADIERIVARVLITKPLENAITGFFDTGSSGGGGGFLGNLLSFLPSFDVGTNYVPRDMIAQVHKGEEIIPAWAAGEGRGGNVNVQVIDRAGVKVSQQRSETQQGTDIKIMIDDLVADNMRRPNSKTGQTLREMQGQSLIRR